MMNILIISIAMIFLAIFVFGKVIMSYSIYKYQEKLNEFYYNRWKLKENYKKEQEQQKQEDSKLELNMKN